MCSTTYVTDTVRRLEVSDSGQGANRVGVSSDGDVDGQLGALEAPQPGIFRISSTLEVLVQLLSDRVWDVDPMVNRVEVGGDLAIGGTRDRRLQGRGPISPRNSIYQSVVGGTVVYAVVVQGGVTGDLGEIRDVVLLEVVRSNVENLRQVHDLADGENTTKRLVGPFVILERADEQGPIRTGVWLSEDPGDETIS